MAAPAALWTTLGGKGNRGFVTGVDWPGFSVIMPRNGHRWPVGPAESDINYFTQWLTPDFYWCQYTFKNRLQSSFLILSEFKRIN